MTGRNLPTMQVGLQIPSFTFPGRESADIFPTVAKAAQTAEANGFDTILVMDHFYQLPHLGPQDDPMLECYSILSAIGAVTTTAKLSALVTGVTYRNPAMLAKAVTTLDVVSGGRAVAGIGAAWFEAEHDALDFEFPPTKVRFEKLEDALNILRLMFDNHQSSYSGTHHSITDAFNSPHPVQSHLPIMVGGSGEKKTFRMAVQYADMLNMTAGHAEITHKLSVINEHCANQKRDRSTIEVSSHNVVLVADTEKEFNELLKEGLAARGFDTSMTREQVEGFLGRALFGTPEQVIAKVKELRGLGLDSITVALMGGVHDTDQVALAGRTLSAAFA